MINSFLFNWNKKMSTGKWVKMLYKGRKSVFYGVGSRLRLKKNTKKCTSIHSSILFHPASHLGYFREDANQTGLRLMAMVLSQSFQFWKHIHKNVFWASFWEVRGRLQDSGGRTSLNGDWSAICFSLFCISPPPRCQFCLSRASALWSALPCSYSLERAWLELPRLAMITNTGARGRQLWARTLICHSLKSLFSLMVSIQRIAQRRWHWLLTYSECGRLHKWCLNCSSRTIWVWLETAK